MLTMGNDSRRRPFTSAALAQPARGSGTHRMEMSTTKWQPTGGWQPQPQARSPPRNNMGSRQDTWRDRELMASAPGGYTPPAFNNALDRSFRTKPDRGTALELIQATTTSLSTSPSSYLRSRGSLHLSQPLTVDQGLPSQGSERVRERRGASTRHSPLSPGVSHRCRASRQSL